MNKAELFFKEKELMVVEKKKSYSISYSDIQLIEYDKPYLLVWAVAKKKYIISQSLNDFCNRLPEEFIKCNNSTCINIFFVTSIEKNDEGLLEVMLDKKKVVVSRRRIAPMKDRFLFIHRTYFQKFQVPMHL